MQFKLSDIAKITGGRWFGKDSVVHGISVDSRQVKKGDLFVAVVGNNADGHDFINDAFNRGATGALVSKEIAGNFPRIRVRSVVCALAKIAGVIRDSFRGKVIGITGSVGKTTTKELLAVALGDSKTVLKSEGNLNTEYGLPITWMKLDKNHRHVVLEMAMRGEGQIAHLCSFSRPHIGVITSIGTAHIGELGSRDAILKAKAELLESLPNDGVAVLPMGDDFVALSRYSKCGVRSFGEDVRADVRVLFSRTCFKDNTTEVEIHIENKRITGRIPGLGRHQAINASAVIAVCMALGIEPQAALNRMQNAELPSDRLRAIECYGATLLVDIYNSSPESCKEALKILLDARGFSRKIAILGDMLELGAFSEGAHREMGRLLSSSDVDVLVTVGELAPWILDEAKRNGYKGKGMSVSSSKEAASFLENLQPGDLVLIKGSRRLQLEKALATVLPREGGLIDV